MTLIEEFNKNYIAMVKVVTKTTKAKFKTEETVLIITRPLSTLIKIIKKNEALPEKSDIYNSVLVAKLYLRAIKRPKSPQHLTKKQISIRRLEDKIYELERLAKKEEKNNIELPNGVKIR